MQLIIGMAICLIMGLASGPISYWILNRMDKRR